MNFSSNAAAVHKPLGKYCHTTLVPASAHWLVVSGQVGIDKNGKLATNLRKQADFSGSGDFVKKKKKPMRERACVILISLFF